MKYTKVFERKIKTAKCFTKYLKNNVQLQNLI